MALHDSFVRLPTILLDALIGSDLTRTQYLIVLWVIRQTYGWNRPSAPFTWYRIAKELSMSRPALYRAGQALMAKGVLISREGQLAIEIRNVADRQLLLPGQDVAWNQGARCRPATSALPAGNEKRCSTATVFRRAKDSKDILKTYKDRPRHRGCAQTPSDGANKHQGPASAVKPISGKYDGLSKN